MPTVIHDRCHMRYVFFDYHSFYTLTALKLSNSHKE
jgi:hypothetical protein